MRTGVPISRLGVTASRRVGKAVHRNHIKRRIREWFRQHRDELPVGRDIVVIARQGAAKLDSSLMWRQLSTAGERLRSQIDAGSRG